MIYSTSVRSRVFSRWRTDPNERVEYTRLDEKDQNPFDLSSSVRIRKIDLDFTSIIPSTA